MRRVLVVRQDDTWQLLSADDLTLAAEVAAPKVPLPEPPHEIEEEVIRQEIKATTDVLINLSPSSSIVPAVPAGQTLPDTSLPCLMVATPSLQQASGLLQQPSGLSLPTSSRGVFDSLMDREVTHTVFGRMLAEAAAPFVGSPDLRPGAMDTSTNPAWLLFGWDHAQATFSSVYEVSESPNHGDHGFLNLNHNQVLPIGR